jgi:cytochrome c biogenesis protein CcmG/thiol:disulfide interchange protein DsbE
MKKFTYIASLFILILWTIPNAVAEDFPTAPPWQLTTQAGKTIALSDYQGKPIILHFWATWCPYCKKLQPKLVELEKKYQSSGIKVVAISFNEDKGATPEDEIKSRGYNFITVIKGELVADKYGVRGTYTTFFVNRQSKVIYKSTSSDVNNPKLALAVQEITKR